MNLKFKKAFTLAEVLITLAVIGVVASLTIPALMTNIDNQDTVVKLKKASAILSQAYLSIRADGTDINSLFKTVNDPMPFYNVLIPKLSVMKNCGQGAGCTFGGTYKTLNNGAWDDFSSATYAKARLNDGMEIIVYGPSVANCNWSANKNCTVVTVDLNGDKTPNILGRDVFQFWITPYTVAPLGTLEDPPLANCSTSSSGNSCAAKVIQEGRISY